MSCQSQEGYERAQVLLYKNFRLLRSNERTAADKKWAGDNHKAIHKKLKQLCKRPGSLQCADCTATRPGWTALPHGVHICINCAQIHRRIGRHISQVKSIFSGTYHWHRDEINVIKMMGNANAARLYLGGKGGNRVRKPDRNAGVEVIEKYIRAKYEEGRWLNPAFTLAPKTRPAKATVATTKKPTRTSTESNKLFAALENSSWTTTTPTVASIRPPPTSAPATAPTTTVSPDTDFFSMFDMKPAIAKTATKPVKPATSKSAWESNMDDILNLY